MGKEKLGKKFEEQARRRVYVIELDGVAMHRRRLKYERKRLISASDRCIYVGETGVDPQERFQQHKEGYKDSRWVRTYGLRLRLDLCAGWGPYKSSKASQAAERRLATVLRQGGYLVYGGH